MATFLGSPWSSRPDEERSLSSPRAAAAPACCGPSASPANVHMDYFLHYCGYDNVWCCVLCCGDGGSAVWGAVVSVTSHYAKMFAPTK